jgi:hypothetical protein
MAARQLKTVKNKKSGKIRVLKGPVLGKIRCGGMFFDGFVQKVCSAVIRRWQMPV